MSCYIIITKGKIILNYEGIKKVLLTWEMKWKIYLIVTEREGKKKEMLYGKFLFYIEKLIVVVLICLTFFTGFDMVINTYLLEKTGRFAD